MTRAQLAHYAVAALVGGGITAGLLTATGEDLGSSAVRGQDLLAAPAADEQLSAREIYDRAAPAVVHIRARSVQPGASPFEVDSGPAQGISTGSGFVLDEDGHVVTNAHVVSGVTDVQVTFAGLQTVPAVVVGKDEDTDLAVLRVDPDGLDLQPLELGDSDQVRTGDRAVAMGNPSGLETTAGTGGVSAPRARIETPGGYVLEGVIRTDAVIGPGTSGGPLIGADGRVIGITSSIGGSESPVGFAVPSNTAKTVFAQFEENHKVIRPWLGIRGRTIDPARPAPDGDGRAGVLVQSVYPGGPAALAGLRGEDGGSDVIEAIDGRPVHTLKALLDAVERHQPGDTVQLRVLRDGSRSELEVRLAERPATLPAP
ncbi:MAG: S1C family serine protease [Solirubrobacteraceae bacterium]